MLNVNELENKWLRYKIRSYTPYIVIAFSFLIIGFILYSITESKTIIKKDKAPIKKELKPIVIIKKIAVIQKDINKTIEPEQEPIKPEEKKIVKIIKKEKVIIKETKEKLLLKPSLNFMKEINNNTLPYYNNLETNVKSKSNSVDDETIIQEEKVQEKKKIEEKKSVISIERRDIESDIAHVIKRFNKNHNPALSLFIAKKYYELGNYKKAYNYSLMTNDLNNEIEVSWIIFAKSLVKLKKKDKAIKTLNKYIKHSNSSQARVLLDDIESGKFK